MKLWHVSEDPGIEVFLPRAPQNSATGIDTPVIWAIDDLHLPHYLMPRDCPRVAYYALPTSSPTDLQRFFVPNTVQHVVAIESKWLERANSSSIWLYELPTDVFQCFDATAGYHVTSTPVRPVAIHKVQAPLAQISKRGVELRIVNSLWPLARAVAKSTLAFSCIRMGNAVPWSQVDQIEA